MSQESKDNVLEFLVNIANEHDFSLDLTLNVKGSLISGTLVSAKEYFETLSETFEEGSEISEKISEQLVHASESAAKGGSEVQFIHLKNTKVYVGDSKPTPSKGKVLWRGSLGNVDGFFLGKIAESKTSTSKK
ncbi:gas vesicle accessory protein GvpU [Falsibacillus pallidus]|uniref:gas vesicle accessory protein GvpU n=1 Tax=Falsibacillus pallidus TaxID=493781 RepID=UPI003D98D93F